MQSAYVPGVPSIPQPSPGHNHQAYQSNTGAPPKQQLSHNTPQVSEERHLQYRRSLALIPADTYHYQDFGAVPLKPMALLLSPKINGVTHPSLLRTIRSHGSYHLLPSAPPASHIPASVYNSNTYGPMPGVQQSPVGPVQYHARLGFDTSTWEYSIKRTTGMVWNREPSRLCR
jgi:hypothetical protein